MGKKNILGRQYPTKKEKRKLGIVLRREFRIAVGDQRTFNEEQRRITKVSKQKAKRLKAFVKKSVKRGLK